jgi:hypothetical protein
MTITLFDDYLFLQSDKIDEVIATPGDFTKIEISGDINCCTSGCGDTVTTEIFLNPFTTTAKLELTATGIKVFPAFFGLTEFTDGVYKFDVKSFETDQVTLESNCLFVDITFKCKVAALLKCIIEENKIKTGEKTGTIIHLLHYGLVNGSNCGCNCSDMCVAFRELSALLDSANPEIFTNCGC